MPFTCARQASLLQLLEDLDSERLGVDFCVPGGA